MLDSTLVCVVLFVPIYIGLSMICFEYQCYENVSMIRLLASLCVSFIVMCHAIRTKKLTHIGCFLAFYIGVILTLSSFSYISMIIVFFFICVKASKYACHGRVESYRRNSIQVLCNGGFASIMAFVQLVILGPKEDAVILLNPDNLVTPYGLLYTWIHLSVLGSLSYSCGDTLASELSPLISSTAPVLITQPWKQVPHGTNGGVTLVGFILSCIGGGLIGFVDWLYHVLIHTRSLSVHPTKSHTLLILIGAFMGLLGSCFDSVLGATCQFSGINKETKEIVDYPSSKVKPISGRCILDNNLVNFLGTLFSGLLTPLFVSKLLH